MLFLTRIATSVVLSVFLFVVLFMGTLIAGGAAAGAAAGREHPEARDFQSGYDVGQRAGAEFAQKYVAIIFLGALGVSGITSLAVSFSGLLPWCRRKPQPPEIF